MLWIEKVTGIDKYIFMRILEFYIFQAFNLRLPQFSNYMSIDSCPGLGKRLKDAVAHQIQSRFRHEYYHSRIPHFTDPEMLHLF
jgi:hypothetical protein